MRKLLPLRKLMLKEVLYSRSYSAKSGFGLSLCNKKLWTACNRNPTSDWLQQGDNTVLIFQFLRSRLQVWNPGSNCSSVPPLILPYPECWPHSQIGGKCSQSHSWVSSDSPSISFITYLIGQAWSHPFFDQSLASRKWWTKIRTWGHMDIEKLIAVTTLACFTLLQYAPSLWVLMLFISFCTDWPYAPVLLGWLYLACYSFSNSLCHYELLLLVSISALVPSNIPIPSLIA